MYSKIYYLLLKVYMIVVLRSSQRMPVALVLSALLVYSSTEEFWKKFPIMSGSPSSFSSAVNRPGSTFWVTSKLSVSGFNSGKS